MGFARVFLGHRRHVWSQARRLFKFYKPYRLHVAGLAVATCGLAGLSLWAIPPPPIDPQEPTMHITPGTRYRI